MRARHAGSSVIKNVFGFRCSVNQFVQHSPGLNAGERTLGGREIAAFISLFFRGDVLRRGFFSFSISICDLQNDSTIGDERSWELDVHLRSCSHGENSRIPRYDPKLLPADFKLTYF